MRADRELWVDRSRTRMVEAGAESGFVLAGKGQEIPAAEVKRLGLVMHEGRVRQGYPEPEPVVREPAPLPETDDTPEPSVIDKPAPPRANETLQGPRRRRRSN